MNKRHWKLLQEAEKKPFWWCRDAWKGITSSDKGKGNVYEGVETVLTLQNKRGQFSPCTLVWPAWRALTPKRAATWTITPERTSRLLTLKMLFAPQRTQTRIHLGHADAGYQFRLAPRIDPTPTPTPGSPPSPVVCSLFTRRKKPSYYYLCLTLSLV